MTEKSVKGCVRADAKFVGMKCKLETTDWQWEMALRRREERRKKRRIEICILVTSLPLSGKEKHVLQRKKIIQNSKEGEEVEVKETK